MGKYSLIEGLVAQRNVLFLAVAIALFSACSQTEPPITSSLEMAWSYDSLDTHGGQSLATFTVSNNGTIEIEGVEWAIYFSQLRGPRKIITQGSGLRIESVTGDYRKLVPDSSFAPLAPGGSRSVQVSYGGFVGRISYEPVGAYFVDNLNANSPGIPVIIKENNTFPGLTRDNIQKLLDEDVLSRYQENARIEHIPSRQSSLVPTPVNYERSGSSMTFGGSIAISYTDGLESEGEFLQELLSKVFTGKTNLEKNLGIAQMILIVDETIDGEEAYQLNVTKGAVEIRGSDPAGVFYGIQTLARLIPVENYREAKNYLNISGCEIVDYPRFQYRGLHLDVARNFHSLKHVKRVIDLMSYYKLNKLHLTLTNDEGWRLEIPGLPELTEVGSRRGHTLDESDMLYPAYGSGPFANSVHGAGTGFYSRKDFITLLRYADERHIEIIPEIDVPGHARAAIKAMIARQNKYEKEGDLTKAGEYLLHDPDDLSEYSSAQNYSDNVICVCQESSYRFIEKVIDEVTKMYREADAPFTTIHSGGDEVPYGAWQKSPICDSWVARNEAIASTDDLIPYFQSRFISILEKYELTCAGWEEIVLKATEEGHNGKDINFGFKEKDVLPYVWNSVRGWGREDMAYRLANGGYPVIMCNSGDLYFDLAYNRDPSEPGLTWSGYVDTRSAFQFAPMDMFATATEDANGEPLDPEYLADKVRLNTSAKKNILGIQGQLWSETVRNSDRIEYYLFPKLLGLAERAWSGAPDWTIKDDKNERLEAMDAAWGRFANTVGQVELPRLDNNNEGVLYRIPMPGAVYLGGQLSANVRYPGLEIRYTTDGTDPVSSSTLYEKQLRLDVKEIRLRAFNSVGRGGRTSVVRAE